MLCEISCDDDCYIYLLAMCGKFFHQILLVRNTAEELSVHVKHFLGTLNHWRTAVDIVQEIGVTQLY